MTPLSLVATVALLVLAVAPASADTMYSWKDAQGQLHFSNRVERVPPGAKVASPPPLGTSRMLGRASRTDSIFPPAQRSGREHRGARVDTPGRAMARAIGRRLDAAGHRNNFTLFVDGKLVMARPGGVLQVKGVDRGEEWNVLAGAAVAEPARGSASETLALDVYRVAQTNGRSRNGVCRDYRRAFAIVGVAASRDRQVGRSFHEIARHFVGVAAQDYRAQDEGRLVPMHVTFAFDEARVVRRRAMGSLQVRGGDLPSGGRLVEEPMTAQLPPWLVDGHIAQLDALSGGLEGYVEELTVALEEIDRAARAAGCW